MSETRSPPGRRIDGEGTAFGRRQGRRDHRRAPAESARRPRPRSSREGAKVAIGDLDKPLAEEAAAELGGETIGLELDVTRPRLVRQLPRPGLGAARPARRADQQRRDHADRPVRRRGRRDRAADDRHQPARRHLRDEAGASGDAAARPRAHRQPRLPGGQGRASRAAPPIARPSTRSSA